MSLDGRVLQKKQTKNVAHILYSTQCVLHYISPKGPLCSAFRVMQKSTQVRPPNTSSVVLCPHLVADRLWHGPDFWADDYYGGSVNSPDA